MTLEDKMKALKPERRKRIEARATELIVAEMSLRALRQAHKRTQVSLAKALHMSQDGVSRLEQRSDVLLSTLRRYVEAMGGTLSLIAEFPDQEPIRVVSIAEVNPKPQKPLKPRSGKGLAA